jgi:hypothetical protein
MSNGTINEIEISQVCSPAQSGQPFVPQIRFVREFRLSLIYKIDFSGYWSELEMSWFDAANFDANAPFSRYETGLPNFSWKKITNNQRISQIATKYTKWPYKDQMAIKYL